MTRCETLGVCQLFSCADCPSIARMPRTGLDHQTLDAVDTTNSDKRTELSMNLLDRLGVAKTGGVAKDSKLDKRECPHNCVPTRQPVKLSTGLLWWFSYCLLSFKKIKFLIPHIRQRVQQIKQKGVL